MDSFLGGIAFAVLITGRHHTENVVHTNSWIG
jgi:hypothetical protein